jgi:hypothetical protein
MIYGYQENMFICSPGNPNPGQHTKIGTKVGQLSEQRINKKGPSDLMGKISLFKLKRTRSPIEQLGYKAKKHSSMCDLIIIERYNIG